MENTHTEFILKTDFFNKGRLVVNTWKDGSQNYSVEILGNALVPAGVIIATESKDHAIRIFNAIFNSKDQAFLAELD